MFENPFSFDGRIRRTELGLSYIIYIIGLYIMASESDEGDPSVIFVLIIPLAWFVFAQRAKRCHDLGNSGWFQLIPFYTLWMLFADGDHGHNNYGPDPKGRMNEFEAYAYYANNKEAGNINHPQE
jgi:uncharacterized membrane protein YhaH (DUF805 family)